MWRSWAGIVTRGPRFVKPVECTAKFSNMRLEAAYGREINQLHAPSKLEPSAALCRVPRLRILEWPFYCPPLIVLFNQLLDMPHLSGGWIILAREKRSLTGMEKKMCEKCALCVYGTFLGSFISAHETKTLHVVFIL